MGLATKVTRTQETLKKELWLKRQLSKDLYYKRKQQKRTLSFSYFIQLESKGYSKEISKIIINTLYSYLQKRC